MKAFLIIYLAAMFFVDFIEYRKDSRVNTDIAVCDCDKCEGKAKEGVYNIDVSFKDFKYSLHILLFLLIVYMMGKVREQANRKDKGK